MDLLEKVRALPSKPGVYLMKDSLGGIIYVGKSKNLKNRVGSYFQNIKSRSPKVEKLIRNLKDFEYIITDTEFEAFMLECRLIKELKPRYNSLMKNSLSYTYIKIELQGDFPSIETTSTINEDGLNFYYGPYTNKNTVEKAIQSIKDFYKINCNSNKKNTACLNYSLGLCMGICLGGETITNQYNYIIQEIINLIKGANNTLLEEVNKEMLKASEEFRFEDAAKYRDFINSVSYLISNTKTLEFAEENKNIAMIEFINNCTFKLFLIKRNKILFSDAYPLENLKMKELIKIIKKNILFYFNADDNTFIRGISKDDIDEIQIIYSYLKNSKCNYIEISDTLIYPENALGLEKAIYKLLSFHNEVKKS